MPKNYTLFGEFILNIDNALKNAKKVTTSLEKSTGGVAKEGEKVKRSFGGIARIIGAASVIGWAFEAQQALRQVTREAWELTGQFDHVRTGMEQLSQASGYNLGQVAKDLKAASSGTITLTESMRQVGQSLLLGGGTAIVENLPELFQIARVNARAMGIDVERALESMVTGLGRVSPRWLDNLGIIIDTRKEYAKFASENDMLVSNMTEGEQRIALINAILEKYGPLVNEAALKTRTFAESQAALTAAWQEALSQQFDDPVWQAFTDWLANNIAMGNVARAMTEEQTKATEAFSTALNEAMSMHRGTEGFINIRQFEKEYDEMVEIGEKVDDFLAKGGDPDKILGDLSKFRALYKEIFGIEFTGYEEWFKMHEAIAIAENATREATKAQDELTAAEVRARDASIAAGKLSDNYAKSLDNKAQSAIKAGAEVASVAAVLGIYKAQAEKLAAQPGFINASALEQFKQLNDLADDAIDRLGELEDKEVNVAVNVQISKTGSLREGLISDLQSAVSKGEIGFEVFEAGVDYANELAGAVHNVMQETWDLNETMYAGAAAQNTFGQWLDANSTKADDAKASLAEYNKAVRQLQSDIEEAAGMGLAVKQEDFLPGRLDSPMEPVRRLRDIANLGTDSPWAKMFEIPQDVLDAGQDAVKAWAAGLADRGAELRDINLIDKDAFLRELADIKLARQEKANVMAQLTQWAIDAGLAANEKEAKKLSKDYLGEPTASGLTEGMEDKIEKYKFADFITNAMDEDLDKNVKKYMSSGSAIADAMFSGWEERMNENIDGYQYQPPTSPTGGSGANLPPPAGAVPLT